MISPTQQFSNTSQASQAVDLEKQQLISLIRAVEQARGGNRLIVYWLNDLARITEAAVPPLYDHLLAIGKQKKLDLFLFTKGGDVEAPWRIVTLMREFCNEFAVLIPYQARGAGTLLALGANQIIMTSMGVLSPIDTSRTHVLLPRKEGATESEPISLQDMRRAMSFVRETAEPSGKMTYSPESMAQLLFDKIHPLAIGAIEQRFALAKRIGTRCLGTHMTKHDDKYLIALIVNVLCEDYESPTYPICRKEARDIGLKVVSAPPNVDRAMMDLLKFYMARDINLPKTGVQDQRLKLSTAWLDSVEKQMRVEQNTLVEKDERLRLGDRWIEY